ncbi:MAG: ATPase [Bacteroidales bacterium]
MKTIFFSLIIMFIFLSMSINLKGQADTKGNITQEFKVSGNCQQCKERIENAALIKGVKFAEWNKETDMLKVVFNPSKTNRDAIEQSIANAGHDTENHKATDEAYKKLPECCAYRDGVEKH